MRRGMRVAGKILLGMLGVAVAIAVGWVAHSSSTLLTAQKSADSIAEPSGGFAGEASREVLPTGNADSAVSSDAVEQLVVKYGSISLEVKDLDSAIDEVRRIVDETDGEIADLRVSSGNSWGGYPEYPVPADGVSATVSPRSASITLRIPANKLSAAEKAAVLIGTVLTQTSSQADVTQQHVDMKARLDNLIAEEARLREFLNRAANVTEMLQVEQELSRVRGEIESLQAQLDYLDDQIALSTLTIYLSEPGSAIQPSGGTWGFSAAVRTGIQAAVAIVRGTIIVLLAISPFVFVAIVVFAGRAVWLRRRAERERRNA